MKKLIYNLLKFSNDYNAVKKDKVGRRVKRRLAGKAAGRLFRKI